MGSHYARCTAGCSRKKIWPPAASGRPWPPTAASGGVYKGEVYGGVHGGCVGCFGQKKILAARIDTGTSTTKTSFLLGDWAALPGVVDGDFGPRKWPSIEEMEKFDEMNKIF